MQVTRVVKFIRKGEKGDKGDPGANYLILGWWSDEISYKLSDAGIPVVKVPDASSLGYSVYKLVGGSSTIGTSPAGSSEWELVESAEFIYMQDAYIEHLQAIIVTAKMVRTSAEGARTEIDASGLSIFNTFGNKNIEFGLDENGMAVMRYFDDSGSLLYDLGPAGLQKSTARAEAWVQIHTMTFLAAFPGDINPAFNKDLIKNTKNATKATVYRYVSKINAGVNLDPENDGLLFSAPSKNISNRLMGVFTTIRSANPQYLSDGLQGQLTDLPNMHPSNEAVYGGYSIYFAPVSNYISGKLNQPSSYNYYWNEGRIPE